MIEVEGKQVKCIELDREGTGQAKSAAKKAGTSLYFAVGCGTRSEVRVEGMWSLVQTFEKSSGEDFLPAAIKTYIYIYKCISAILGAY